MDYSACSVLYLDRRAKEVGTLTSKSLDRCIQEGLASLGEEEAGNNIHVILSTFGEGMLSLLSQTISTNLIKVLVLTKT